MDSDGSSEAETTYLLQKRQQITEALLTLPYDLIAYIERAEVYSELGYPDLAAGDCYRALLLCDEVANEGFEYHAQALETLRARGADGVPITLRDSKTRHGDLAGGVVAVSREAEEKRKALKLARIATIQCYRSLAISLLLCGCLRSAYKFCATGLAMAPEDEELLQAKGYIEHMAKRRMKTERVDVADLPDQGLVRREIYPWNDHEPDRYSQETLDFLNEQLAEVSPSVEAKITELPTLPESSGKSMDDAASLPMNKQLGLFAKIDIPPGEMVLDEFSLLAANNRLKGNLCDACSLELPPLTADSTVIGCPECEDIMFCNDYCLRRAQEEYHPAVCDKDIDTISKDPDPKDKPNALYLLLLSRSLAMAATQEVHLLELKEVKHIWGDFLPSSANAVPLSGDAQPPPVWTLPFSFEYNIAAPIHVLEKMDLDIFAELPNYDLWILNTLYSKFRGTASARVNNRNGHPEVAAVHPLWCLANHDCNPNVQWEWKGRMKLWVREKRIGGLPGGIKKGEEILNHYCDIDLKVQDRREWAQGSLGGYCMCERCRKEAAEGQEAREPYSNGVGGEHLANGVTT